MLVIIPSRPQRPKARNYVLALVSLSVNTEQLILDTAGLKLCRPKEEPSPQMFQNTDFV